MGTSMWADVKEYGQAEDVPRFVDALVVAAEAEGYWGNKLNELKKVLEVSALRCRTPAAVALSKRIPQLADENARTFLEYVVDSLINDYGRDVDLAEAEAVLGIATGYWYFDSHQLAKLGEIVLTAGRSLPDEVIAVMRRTAAGPYGDKSLKQFVAQIKLPLLNRGEPLADRVLDDLSTLGEGWHELVTHAVTETDDVPTPNWEQQSRQLLASVGEAEARHVITAWLTLVGKPGNQPLLSREGFDIELALDPFNASAVRGLVWLLGLLPADAELARMLAGLVEYEPAQGARYRAARSQGRRRCHPRPVPPRRPGGAGTALAPHHAGHQQRALNGPARRPRRAGRRPQRHPRSAGRLCGTGLRPGRGRQAHPAIRRRHRDPVVENGACPSSWRNAAGLALGSAPSAVKANFAERAQGAQGHGRRNRQDAHRPNGPPRPRSRGQPLVALRFWRDHYLDHPLLGTLTRRLLWLVGARPCGFADGCATRARTAPLRMADEEEVTLALGDPGSARHGTGRSISGRPTNRWGRATTPTPAQEPRLRHPARQSASGVAAPTATTRPSPSARSGGETVAWRRSRRSCSARHARGRSAHSVRPCRTA